MKKKRLHPKLNRRKSKIGTVKMVFMSKKTMDSITAMFRKK